MLRASPTSSLDKHPTNSSDIGRAGPRTWQVRWGRLLPRPRRLTRLLAYSLAVCLTSQAVLTPPVSAQRVAPPAAYAVAEQVPAPTPTPSGSSQPATVQIELGPTTTITDKPTENSIQGQIAPGPEFTVMSGARILRGECTSANYVFQGCPFADALGVQGGAAAERRIEARAVSLVLEQYGLPESARQQVMRYGRDEVRAALFGDVLEAFRTMQEERNPDQQLLVDVYSGLVRDRHLRGLQAAQRQFRRWSNDPCGYIAPPGFSYNAQSACIGASQSIRPESPGLAAFIAYGLKEVYEDDVVEDPRSAPAFVATSSGILLLYGAAATGFASAVGSQISIPTSMLNVVAPFAARKILVVVEEGASAAGAASSGGGAGASVAYSMAAMVGIIVAAISTAITGGISVSREAEIPGQLQGLIDNTSDVSVEWVLRNCVSACVNAGTTDLKALVERELYASVVFTTLPELRFDEPPPAARPGDPRFVVDGRPTEWLRYKSDDKEGTMRAVRLGSGPWFIDRADSEKDSEARLTLQVSFVDAAGATWAVRRVGDEFLIVRTGLAASQIDYPAPKQSPAVPVLDANGKTVIARVGK